MEQGGEDIAGLGNRADELWGKTLGVVGLGQIGARVARIAKGFDMEVIGYDPFMGPEQYGRVGVEPVGLADLLSRSDVVTLHVPLTPDTEKMLDATGPGTGETGHDPGEHLPGTGDRRGGID
ncbi:MAG: hypothetical protein MZU91_02645 [Desulfosudis oleivorans]|nr:hypothetical protein [Desulfosudis oleivorans]